jgi:hypothetical protein
MSTVSDSHRITMALPANQAPPWMNLQATRLSSSYPIEEELKDDLQFRNKKHRIHHAIYLLKEMLRKRMSRNYKPEKVYGDALYKALLRQLRRWVRNLLDPVLLNAKPN